MMDHFREDIIARRSTVLFDVLYIAAWLALVMLALSAFLTLQVMLAAFSFEMLLILAASVAAAVWLFFMKDYLKMEYEYTFTNGTLDFARVLCNVKRKELGSMNVQNVAACGHVAHESFKRYLSMKGLSKRNWFLNRDGNLFYFYYEKDGRKHLIVIEPSEEMVGMIRPYLPQGVYRG